MKISHEIPSIYEECRKHFGVDWDKGIIMTYGDTVYCKFDLSEQKLVHEQIHIEQQSKIGVEKWWQEYFKNKEFRLSQELEAYVNEAKFIKNVVKDRNQKFNLIRTIALDLSGYIYGNIISYNEAFKTLNQ